jgi:hypothetical protein
MAELQQNFTQATLRKRKYRRDWVHSHTVNVEVLPPIGLNIPNFATN